ncbi:hypothetical protein BDV3_000493 [Batrachochytrium dendrobatidis]|uniref:Uncharacterized protein n=1 Tax=Batrachochytrium dendrobatidis (strain JEL423) TaxID=403673 RepID=A0A177WCV2_BATDL|nr:hypothetical protein BDEG_21527 [Batrachochytrium dendrobatidis JEL423]
MEGKHRLSSESPSPHSDTADNYEAGAVKESPTNGVPTSTSPLSPLPNSNIPLSPHGQYHSSRASLYRDAHYGRERKDRHERDGRDYSDVRDPRRNERYRDSRDERDGFQQDSIQLQMSSSMSSSSSGRDYHYRDSRRNSKDRDIHRDRVGREREGHRDSEWAGRSSSPPRPRRFIRDVRDHRDYPREYREYRSLHYNDSLDPRDISYRDQQREHGRSRYHRDCEVYDQYTDVRGSAQSSRYPLSTQPETSAPSSHEYLAALDGPSYGTASAPPPPPSRERWAGSHQPSNLSPGIGSVQNQPSHHYLQRSYRPGRDSREACDSRGGYPPRDAPPSYRDQPHLSRGDHPEYHREYRDYHRRDAPMDSWDMHDSHGPRGSMRESIRTYPRRNERELYTSRESQPDLHYNSHGSSAPTPRPSSLSLSHRLQQSPYTLNAHHPPSTPSHQQPVPPEYISSPSNLNSHGDHLPGAAPIVRGMSAVYMEERQGKDSPIGVNVNRGSSNGGVGARHGNIKSSFDIPTTPLSGRFGLAVSQSPATSIDNPQKRPPIDDSDPFIQELKRLRTEEIKHVNDLCRLELELSRVNGDVDRFEKQLVVIQAELQEHEKSMTNMRVAVV